MANPTPYKRSYSFSGYQTVNPKKPLPAPDLDNEFENVERSLGQAISGLEDVRRSDGKLQNGVVTVESFGEELFKLNVVKVEGVVEFANRATAVLTEMDPGLMFFRLAGYTAAGDGGAASYRKISEPSDPKAWHIESADGSWWELAERQPTFDMFGVPRNAAAGPTVTRIQAALDYMHAIGGGTVYGSEGTYIVGGGVTISIPANVSLVGAPNWGTVLKLTANLSGKNILEAIGAVGTQISGLYFDCGDFDGGVNSGAIGITGTGWRVSANKIVKMGRYGIVWGDSHNGWEVSDNYIERTTYSNAMNQGLLCIGSNSSERGRVVRNTLVRTASDFCFSHTLVADNVISGWGFGAGITIEQSATLCHHNIITGNICRDSVGMDANGYRCGGIENWGMYSIISDNVLDSNSGTAIDQGGFRCLVANNVSRNNGLSQPTAMFAGRYQDATYNGSFSTYVGNTIIDEAGGAYYGYSDQSALIQSCTIGKNDFRQVDIKPLDLKNSSHDVQMPTLYGTTGIGAVTLPAAGTVELSVMTFPGASIGDVVHLSSLSLQNGLILYGYVSAPNAVRLMATNPTSISQTMAASTFAVMLTKRPDALY